MPAPNIANYMARVVELQEGLIANSKAYPFAEFNAPINAPVWVNQVAAMPSSRQNTGDVYIEWIITIVMSLHRGQLQEGEQGILETLCYADMTTVLEEFTANRRLTTATYTEAQPGFIPSGVPQITAQLFASPDAGMGTRYEYIIYHQSEGYR